MIVWTSHARRCNDCIARRIGAPHDDDHLILPGAGAAAPDQIALDLAAFVRSAPWRQALPLDRTPRYTLEAIYAIGKALQTSGNLAPFRRALAALPDFDLNHLDHHEERARALRWVHAEIQRRVQRLKDMPELTAEGYPLRALMLSYVELLACKNVVSPEVPARIREGSGHRDLAEDLTVLAHELSSLPPHVTADTAPVTRAEVSRGAAIAHEIMKRLGLEDNDLSLEALHLERQKLAALLLESQAQLRRGMDYLRFAQGDAAELVPSLFVPGGRPRTQAEAPDPVARLTEAHQHLHEEAAAPLAPGDNPFSED